MLLNSLRRVPFLTLLTISLAWVWLVIFLVRWRQMEASPHFNSQQSKMAASEYHEDGLEDLKDPEGPEARRSLIYAALPDDAPQSSRPIIPKAGRAAILGKDEMSSKTIVATQEPPSGNSDQPSIPETPTTPPPILDSLVFHNLAPDSEFQRVHLYERLARRYLAPWLPIADDIGRAPVTQRMLGLMEYVYRGGSFRVRFVDGKLLYRVLIHYDQTYRFQRMTWILGLLSQMAKEGLLAAPLDAVFYVGDGPKVPMDTFDRFAGFPLFSLRTSELHIDIPIPDPVAFGSNGSYQWPPEARTRYAWTDKLSTAVFRGKASCLKMQADNWHVCNRVRAAKLSDTARKAKQQQGLPAVAWPVFGDDGDGGKQVSNRNGTSEALPLLDIGITEWNQVRPLDKVSRDGMGLVPAPNPAEIEDSTGLSTSAYMDYYEQSRYKYILDLDGGLGSSRKEGILGSSSLLIAQDSPWRSWFEPCLQPTYHYLKFDRALTTLRATVQWARDHDAQVQAMIHAANDFHQRFLSLASAKTYLSVLLGIYVQDMLVQKDLITDHLVSMNFCDLVPENKDIPRGPMGCSQGWFLWDDLSSPSYWKGVIQRLNKKRKTSEEAFL